MSNLSGEIMSTLLEGISPNRQAVQKLSGKTNKLDSRELAGSIINNMIRSSVYASQIHPGTRDFLTANGNTLPGSIADYEPMDFKAGETYLPLLSADANLAVDCTLIIEIVRTEAIPEDADHEVKTSFLHAMNAVASLLKSQYPGQIIVQDDFYNSLWFSLKNRKHQDVTLSFSGRSAELPMALAIYSYLIKKPLQSCSIASGKLKSGGRIDTVDGLERKLKAAMEEYHEITAGVIPQAGVGTISDVMQQHIVPVSTLAEAVQHFIPGFAAGTVQPDFENVTGLHYFACTPVFAGDKDQYKGYMLTFNMNSNLLPMHIAELLVPSRYDGDLLILNGRMTIWLSQYLALIMHNRVSVLAVNDSKIGIKSENQAPGVSIPAVNDSKIGVEGEVQVPGNTRKAVVVKSNTNNLKPGTVILYR